MGKRKISKLTNSDSVAGWLVPVLLLILLIFSWFSPWLIAGKVLAPFDIVEQMIAPWREGELLPLVHNHFVTDAVTQYIPYRLFAARSFAEDGYIGWNPLVFGGMAQTGNTMALCYDWTTQLYRVLDFWTSWHLGRIVQFLIAGVGMMVFLQSQGCGRGVAMLGAVAYMLNTQFVAWIYHQWALASFCWLPWLLWSLYAAKQKSGRFVGLAGIFLALSLLAATLQHVVFVLLALACVWLGWLSEGRWSSFTKTTVIFLLVGLLGAGSVAFALEPTITGYIENILSGHQRGGLGYDSGPWQPLLNALALPFTVFPFLLGSVQTLDLGKLFQHSVGALGFFGTVPVILSMLALFTRSVPAPARLLMLAGVIIPLTPLVGPLYHRVNLLWILGGCWGASAWLAGASPAAMRRVVSWLWRALFVIAGLWMIASFAIVAARSWLDPFLLKEVATLSNTSQFGGLSQWMQARALALPSYLCIWNPCQAAALGGAALSVWGLGWAKADRGVLSLVAACGVAVQLSVFWWQWATWSDPCLPYGKSGLVELLQNQSGSTGRLSAEPRPLPADMLPPNTLMPVGVAIAGGYDSIHPRRMSSPSDLLWDFPGTTHHLAKVGENNPTGWLQVWTDGEWILWRNPIPSFGLVSLKEGPEMPVSAGNFSRPTFNTMEVRVSAGAKSIELFSNWHRGWKWKGGRLGTWKDTAPGANGGVLVSLDAPVREDETVFLRFKPSSSNWAVIVSVLSASSLLLITLGVRRPFLVGVPPDSTATLL